VSDTLVDSSAWIAFFRGERSAVRRIDRLLADGRVATWGPVAAEVLSGVPSRKEFDLLRELFGGLVWLADPASLWERVAEQRFLLARKGYQASLVDLAISLAASDAGHALLTRDSDFRRIQEGVAIELHLF
jgi:predicted nucleic acid-binding protein